MRVRARILRAVQITGLGVNFEVGRARQDRRAGDALVDAREAELEPAGMSEAWADAVHIEIQDVAREHRIDSGSYFGWNQRVTY